MKKRAFNYLTMLLGIAFVCCLVLVNQADAKKVKLANDKIKIDGVVVTDHNGNQIATKRLTILWRYSDVDGDGTFTWGGLPEVGDRFRLVNRAIYTFTKDFIPDPNWNGQLSTFHWGPWDPAANSFLPTAFRGVDYDDFIPPAGVPGDYSVTLGEDGPPVPGLSLTSSLFTDSGDWDPNNGPIPVNEPRWGIRYILSFDLGIERKIPAGTVMFMDAQLDMQHLATDANCENGWSVEDWITTGGPNGFIQMGPNTAAPDCNLYPKLDKPPVLYDPCETVANSPVCP